MYTVYLAGSLFNLRELAGNTELANAISKVSEGKYQCLVPQDLEQRDTSAKAIRDADIKAVIESDLIIAQYDGTELDSGTVVEYMIAKFLDIPAVLLRTDFRNSGDQDIYAEESDPWNLMTSFFPRSGKVVVDGMSLYKLLGPKQAVDKVAGSVIDSFNEVITNRPITNDHGIQTSVYNWVNATTGFENPYTQEEISDILNRKRKKGLL